MFNRLHHILFASVVFSAILTAPVATANLSDQQELFVAAEKSLKRGDNTAFLKSRDALEGYPLKPYLDYLDLSNRFGEIGQVTIDRFVAEHPSLPQSSLLQRQWLGYLAKRKRWHNYLTAYEKTDINGGQYQCLKGIALEQLGRTSEAWQEAGNLWLIGKSQHKACDPLFNSWASEGQRTQSLIYARFWLTVTEGNTTLARYLDRKISDKQYKQHTALFWKIHQKPQLLTTTRQLDASNPHHRLIMLHGVKRLSGKDIDNAIDAWLALRSEHPFTLKQIARMDKKLALRIAKRFADNASEQIARLDPEFRYPIVTEWRIRNALAEQDWGMVLALINQLPASEQQSSRWSYWQSVADLKFNESPSPFSGNHLSPARRLKKHDSLHRLSQKRNFYAFLVAGLSQQPFQLNHESSEIQEKDLKKLTRKFKGFVRIQEWLKLDRIYSAQSELNRILPQLSQTERKLLPYFASQLEWHHQAIMSAARVALWDDLDIRFPAPQSQLFSQHARLRNIHYPWVLSIARQESAFNPKARSHAGARGLMQLMPATAKQTARQHRIPYRRESELYKPEVNIALGTAHLAWLSGRFENSKIYATAAYNAGSTPVRRWLNDRGHLPLDIWIETIPYDETRRYVQNVLAFMVIYGSRMDSNSPVQMLSPGEMASLTLAPTSLVAQIESQSESNN